MNYKKNAVILAYWRNMCNLAGLDSNYNYGEDTRMRYEYIVIGCDSDKCNMVYKKAEYIRSIIFRRQKQLQVSTQDSINAQKSLPKAAAEGNNMFDTYSAGTKNNRDNKSTRL